jgi:glycosyltransferase involved in cell wall biosynthesis
MTPTVTVLIATHDRAALLERTLQYLNEARRPAGWDVEVLVAANACSDRTHELLDDYRHKASSGATDAGMLPLRWIVEPRAGKSHALNLAIGAVTSDLVAFVDDDHRIDPAYLEQACRAAVEFPDVDIFCGRILPDWDGTEPAWVHDNGRYRVFPLPIPRYDLGEQRIASPQDTATPGGGNWVLRGNLLSRIGTFSAEYGPVGRGLEGSEDKEWIWRAIRAGARVLYVPEIVQYHYVDPERLTLRYLARKAFERSAGAVRLSGETVDAGLVPAYMVRKIIGNAAALATPWPAARFRFHLVRLAASLGEIKGHLQARRERTAQPGHACQ